MKKKKIVLESRHIKIIRGLIRKIFDDDPETKIEDLITIAVGFKHSLNVALEEMGIEYQEIKDQDNEEATPEGALEDDDFEGILQ